MTAALSFRDVHKRFGKRIALNALSFEAPRGAVTGFVGHNGAGKTTAFSLVSGFLQPDSGRIDVLGRGPFEPRSMKGLVGVLPQDAELPDRHTPRLLLDHLARLQGLSARAAAVEADRLIDAVLLTERRDHRIATLSHGMRRRVAVATALLGSPALVLLDEPLSGLDPQQARAVRAVLRGLRGRSSVVVSSHDLADLERTCDWVVMVRDGRCLRQGPIAEVTDQRRIVHWALGAEPPVAELTAALPGHQFSKADGRLVQTAPESSDEAAMDASSLVVARILVGAGVPIRSVQRGVGLEERFLDDAPGRKA